MQTQSVVFKTGVHTHRERKKMASGYEIRKSLLTEANSMLFTEWHAKCDVIRHNAELTKVPIQVLPPAPTAAEIKHVAEELYEFIQRR